MTYQWYRYHHRIHERMAGMTTEELGKKLLQDVQQMSPEEKAKLREQLSKEFSPNRR